MISYGFNWFHKEMIFMFVHFLSFSMVLKDIQKISKRHPTDGSNDLHFFRAQARFSLQNAFVSGITFKGVFEPSF